MDTEHRRHKLTTVALAASVWHTSVEDGCRGGWRIHVNREVHEDHRRLVGHRARGGTQTPPLARSARVYTRGAFRCNSPLSDCGCGECFERPDLRMAGITWSTMFREPEQQHPDRERLDAHSAAFRLTSSGS